LTIGNKARGPPPAGQKTQYRCSTEKKYQFGIECALQIGLPNGQEEQRWHGGFVGQGGGGLNERVVDEIDFAQQQAHENHGKYGGGNSQNF
jgi:hypothetical protein